MEKTNCREAVNLHQEYTLLTIELPDFLLMNLPPRGLILNPWLPEAGLCMIHAFRGVGKTHLSLGVAYAVAKGCSFLGWEATRPRNVLFIDGEMPAFVLQERLRRIIKMSGDSDIPDTLKIITPDLQNVNMPDIGTSEGQAMINKLIYPGLDLIILDNLSCLAPGTKENDSFDWASIQTWVLQLRRQGIAVLIIHHSGKSGSQRGTSKKEDVLDTVIALRRPKDYESAQGARFIIEYEKSRGFFGEDARSFEAHLVDKDDQSFWETRSIEESTYKKVYSLANDGLSPKEIINELGVDKSTVSRHLKRAREEGILQNKENA